MASIFINTVKQNTDSIGNHKGLKMRKPFNINHTLRLPVARSYHSHSQRKPVTYSCICL